jgi:hypothetical protein
MGYGKLRATSMWAFKTKRAMFRGLQTGRFDRVLGSQEECDRWERFLLRTANTPGRERVVLRLNFEQPDGLTWALWAVYTFQPDTGVEKVPVVVDTIFLSEPSTDPAETPDELIDDAHLRSGVEHHWGGSSHLSVDRCRGPNSKTGTGTATGTWGTLLGNTTGPNRPTRSGQSAS